MPNQPPLPRREVHNWNDPEMEEERLAFARRREKHRRPLTYPPKKPEPPPPQGHTGR